MGSRECFEKVFATIDTLITIDKDIVDWEELEYARLNICLLIKVEAKMNKKIKINGIVYQVLIKENI